MRVYRWAAIAATSVLMATTAVVGSTQAAYADLPTVFYAEIHNVHSGKCVNVQYNSVAAGTWIQQYHCDHTPAVKFLIESATLNGVTGYGLVSQNSVAGSQMCVMPLAPSTYLGDPLVLESCFLQFDAFWNLRQTPDGAYQIVNINSGMCIDVPNWSTDDWVVLQQWTCVPGALNQEFLFVMG